MNIQVMPVALRNVLLLCACLLSLSGCSTVYSYKAVGGCGIARYPEEFVNASVQSMTWSAGCDSDGLATGKGVLTVVLKDGRKLGYAGEMDAGDLHGQGTEQRLDGSRYVGDFYRSFPSNAKYYGPDGALVYDGTYYYATYNYEHGKLYEADGGTVEGTFSKDDSPTSRYDVSDIINAVVKEKDGSIAYWLCDGLTYNSLDQYDAAVAAHDAAEAARIAQEQADQAATDAQQQADTDAAVQQLTTAVGAYYGATNYTAPSYTPSPQLQQPTPPQAAPQRQPSLPVGRIPVEHADSCVTLSWAPGSVGYKYLVASNHCSYGIAVYVKVEEDGRWTNYSDLNADIPAQQSGKSPALSSNVNLKATTMAVCPGKAYLEAELGHRITGVYTAGDGGTFGCWVIYENTGVGTGN